MRGDEERWRKMTERDILILILILWDITTDKTRGKR